MIRGSVKSDTALQASIPAAPANPPEAEATAGADLPTVPESVRIRVKRGLLSGQLFSPPGRVPYAPGIVLESPLAGTSDMLTQRMARTLCQHGWTVLLFDHAGFGNSGGQPSRMRFRQQLDDLQSVWWWLRKRTGIDGNRVGLWAHGLGAWRARLLVEHEPELRALVLHAPLWRDRTWLGDPAGGLALLSDAGYFANREPDPLGQPGWALAWLQLLTAPLPRPSRLADTPVLVWLDKRARQNLTDHSDPKRSPRCENRLLSAAVASELALFTGTDPVVAETDAFFRQYL